MTINHRYFYQIDYIDKDGLASYIYTGYNKQECIKRCDILNLANSCINSDTKFVLDKYKNISDDEFEDELIETNITKAETISEHLEQVKNELNRTNKHSK